MLSLLSFGLPKRAVALALAVVVVATTLAVALLPRSVPVVRDVPVGGDLVAAGPKAGAHVVQQCYTYTTYSYPTYQAQQHGAQPVARQVTRCYGVAHDHPPPWWQRALIGGAAGLACGGVTTVATGGNVAAGLYAGAACGALIGGVSG